MKLKLPLLLLITSALSSFAASTINLRNFSSAVVGVPIVDTVGDSLAVGSFFGNAGYFSTSLDFSTASVADIQGAFIGVDTSPISGGTRNGLFTGQTFNGAFASGVAGSNAYIVVGNNADFSLATRLAVFDTGVVFTSPDSFGNSSQTIDATSPLMVVFGTVRTVATQPNNLTGANYASGVVMVPEPSTLLLSALGVLALLRRKR